MEGILNWLTDQPAERQTYGQKNKQSNRDTDQQWERQNNRQRQTNRPTAISYKILTKLKKSFYLKICFDI